MIIKKSKTTSWKDIIDRWHSKEIIDSIYPYYRIASVEREHRHYIDNCLCPITRYVLGNIFSFIARVYYNIYNLDHLEVIFYKSLTIRLHDNYNEYDGNNNGRILIPDEFVDKHKAILEQLPKEFATPYWEGGITDYKISPNRANQLLDFLGSYEFKKVFGSLCLEDVRYHRHPHHHSQQEKEKEGK